MTLEEIVQGGKRIKGRSARPWHDLSLFYLLFATGARPLEIARLEVRDYLNLDGSIRRVSELRAEAAITHKVRPLYFASTRLDEALAPYLAERLQKKQGIGQAESYRGLDPLSRLFLSATGDGFLITPYGEPGQRRFLCRPILETYRKLFRYAGMRGVTALSVRRTVVARLYERGADEDAVGLILGISERSAVRELLARHKPTVEQLLNELI
ncbi:MAG: site-specific integrase [Aquabacterium sp.]|uniref:site-specific integrase n=1 Tax=Aquabacterium sp. TaxID=1872578 RepID=UPI0027291AEC|nr:site-specific integrase [Aquabacterium sp.]MDO9001845.1 site-specific integrase [Aquabacterium sp.]